MTVFSKLIPTAISAYGLQTLLAAIFIPAQTDVFFDMGGALGWLTTTFISMYYPTVKARLWDGIPMTFPPLSTFSHRQLLLNAAVGIWSLRLGTFLGARAIKTGGDSRFETIKKDPTHFGALWFGQATWIMAVGLPIWLVNTLPPSLSPGLGLRDYLGIGLWAASFVFEVTADMQKTAWRRRKELKHHDEKFITSGLWSISRHPNYLGELGIWTGVWLLASTPLQTPAFPAGTLVLSAISPIFTWFLLNKVSGVPGLERHADKKWGAEWQEYKRRVPVFWPWGSTGM